MARDWSTLPELVLHLIADGLTFAGDFVRLRSVCSRWRSALPKRHFSPFLCINRGGNADSPGNPISFVSFDGTHFGYIGDGALDWIRLDRRCFASHRGWLSLIDNDSNFRLFNPITKEKVDLPKFPNNPPRNDKSVSKLLMSSDPSTKENLVVLFYERCRDFQWSRMAFWRPGDEAWTPIGHPIFPYVFDAAFHNGSFIFVTQSEVFTWRGTQQTVNKIAPDLQLYNIMPELKYVFACYLFESYGDLHKVMFGSTDIQSPGVQSYFKSLHDNDVVEEDDGEEESDDGEEESDDDEDDEETEGEDDEESTDEDKSDNDDFMPCSQQIENFKLDSQERVKWLKIGHLGNRALLIGSRSESVCIHTVDHPRFQIQTKPGRYISYVFLLEIIMN